MKNIFISALVIVFGALLFGCSTSKEETPNPIVSEGQKAYIFYNGVVNEGDWIAIDGRDRLYHRLDTSYLYRKPDGTTSVRAFYPELFPIDLSNLWLAQSYIKGMSFTGKWFEDYKSNGLAAYSLFLKLSTDLKIAVPFDTKAENGQVYSVRFANFTPTTWNTFLTQNDLYNKGNMDKLTVVIIERLDGKNVKITTSPNYGAKIDYQQK
jgi:hypothetical protein